MPVAVTAPETPRLLLVGLEDRLATELVRQLPACRWSTASADSFLDPRSRAMLSADMIFCHAGNAALPRVLKAAHDESIPVIVVTEHPDIEEWLNAMDAGAADYTAPPFDRKQIAWILNSNLRPYGSAISVSSRASTVPHA